MECQKHELQQLPMFYRMHHDLLDHWLEKRHEEFLGIDAPEFNLPLELKLYFFRDALYSGVKEYFF